VANNVVFKMSNKKKFYFFLLLILLFSLIPRLYSYDFALPDKDSLHHSLIDDERKILQTSLSINFSKGVFGPETWDYTGLGFYMYRTALEICELLSVVVALDRVKNLELTGNELAGIYIVGRILFVFVGLALIALTGIITKRLFGAREGILAALLIAISPAAVLTGRVIRLHSLVGFFMVLLLYYAIKISKDNILRDHIRGGIAFGLAMSSMYVAFPVFVLPFFASALYWKNSKREKWRLFVVSKKLMLGYLTSGITFCIVSFFVIVNSITNSFYWLENVGRLSSDKFFIDPLSEGAGFFFYSLLPYSFGPFFILIIILALYWVIKTGASDLILLSCGAFSLMFMQLVLTSSRLLVRHTSWYTPYLTILFAVVAIRLLKTGKGIKRIALIVVISLSVIWNIFVSFQLVRWESQPCPQVAASEYLINKITPSEEVATIDNYKELYPYILNHHYTLYGFQRDISVMEVRSDFEKLVNSKVNYFVTPNWELQGLRNKYGRHPNIYPTQYDFLKKLTAKEGPFLLEKSFKNDPPWPKWFFGSNIAPRDIALFGMEILIFRRAGNRISP